MKLDRTKLYDIVGWTGAIIHSFLFVVLLYMLVVMYSDDYAFQLINFVVVLLSFKLLDMYSDKLLSLFKIADENNELLGMKSYIAGLLTGLVLLLYLEGLAFMIIPGEREWGKMMAFFTGSVYGLMSYPVVITYLYLKKLKTTKKIEYFLLNGNMFMLLLPVVIVAVLILETDKNYDEIVIPISFALYLFVMPLIGVFFSNRYVRKNG